MDINDVSIVSHATLVKKETVHLRIDFLNYEQDPISRSVSIFFDSAKCHSLKNVSKEC